MGKTGVGLDRLQYPRQFYPQGLFINHYDHISKYYRVLTRCSFNQYKVKIVYKQKFDYYLSK